MTTSYAAPKITFSFSDLPLTRLHYVTCGEGEPLIMVPATISRLSNWLPLAQFMGQRFKVHFFELPGHGKSAAFPVKFSSKLVAKTLENFIDQLGYSKVSILGFSFGGILTLRALQYLQDRIDKVILISPCVSKKTILFSGPRLNMLRSATAAMKNPRLQDLLVKMLHNESVGFQTAKAFRRIGSVEQTIPLEEILCRLPAATLDVLIYQVNEILRAEFPLPEIPLHQKCYFMMSINDPVLDFQTTLDFLEGYFEKVLTERLTVPYHQPPELPTFDELNRDYGQFLNLL